MLSRFRRGLPMRRETVLPINSDRQGTSAVRRAHGVDAGALLIRRDRPAAKLEAGSHLAADEFDGQVPDRNVAAEDDDAAVGALFESVRSI